MTNVLLIDDCCVATVDAGSTVHPAGYIVIQDGWITAVGAGSAPVDVAERATERIDGRGLMATPGLVNCHHHLYQWLTRGLAQDSNLFDWLCELYPTWAHVDDEMQHAAASAGIAALLRSGCTTSTDHHYLFPHDAGDLLTIEIDCARTLGIRFHPCRGSMDLGVSSGGLPPDSVVEDTDAILAATVEAIDAFHDPDPGSMLRIAVAPCSPFSVTERLMVEASALARSRGVRLHTHAAETLEEEIYCKEHFSVRPIEYLDRLGWLGPDVWLAHGIHLSDTDVSRLAATGTGVAHCPSSNARLGAGIAPVALLRSSGAPVGLGVDGAASNESGELMVEMREALLVARLRDGHAALSAHSALHVATMGGAACLGRDNEIGSLEPGKLGDVALWRIDDLAHAGIADPVAGLVLGPPRTVEHLVVNGRVVVRDCELVTGDVRVIAADLTCQARRLTQRVVVG